MTQDELIFTVVSSEHRAVIGIKEIVYLDNSNVVTIIDAENYSHTIKLDDGGLSFSNEFGAYYPLTYLKKGE